jgi:hypothetical protein
MQPLTISQLQQSAGMAVSQSRQAMQGLQQVKSEHAAIQQQLMQQSQQLNQALLQLQAFQSGGDPSIQRIENVPGRRVPFDYIVEIPVPANSTGVVEGSINISQEGPFVAVSRMATLLSAYQFQYTSPAGGATATFNGRSFGRWRPVHSAWDLNDGQPHSQVVLAANPNFPGNGAPHIVSPANSSPFRSMQQDFRIKVENAGSSFPRSNVAIPSTWWTKSINEPWELAALDFFERGEVITFKCQPLHPSNPAYGNLSGFSPVNANFPFIGSQWDDVEGIDDRIQVLGDSEVDPIVRVPSCILVIGFHGYRIIQQAGAGPH